MKDPGKNPQVLPNDIAVVMFDGMCNLCNSGVNFIIDRDPKRRFRYVSLQSEAGSKLLKKYGLSTTDFDTFVLIENGKSYVRSTAALRIARQLHRGWPLFYGLIIIPRFIRDWFYNLIAANRYRWFGKRDECRVPTPELRSLFLD